MSNGKQGEPNSAPRDTRRTHSADSDQADNKGVSAEEPAEGANDVPAAGQGSPKG